MVCPFLSASLFVCVTCSTAQGCSLCCDVVCDRAAHIFFSRFLSEQSSCLGLVLLPPLLLFHAYTRALIHIHSSISCECACVCICACVSVFQLQGPHPNNVVNNDTVADAKARAPSVFYTGVGDIKKIGTYKEFEGQSYFQWKTKVCKYVCDVVYG